MHEYVYSACWRQEQESELRKGPEEYHKYRNLAGSPGQTSIQFVGSCWQLLLLCKVHLVM